MDMPKLREFTGPYENEEYYICSAEKTKPLTEAQAAEIIRRVEAHDILVIAAKLALNSLREKGECYAKAAIEQALAGEPK